MSTNHELKTNPDTSEHNEWTKIFGDNNNEWDNLTSRPESTSDTAKLESTNLETSPSESSRAIFDQVLTDIKDKNNPNYDSQNVYTMTEIMNATASMVKNNEEQGKISPTAYRDALNLQLADANIAKDFANKYGDAKAYDYAHKANLIEEIIARYDNTQKAISPKPDHDQTPKPSNDNTYMLRDDLIQ